MLGKKLLYEQLTYKIRGAIFAVYQGLGSGYKESVYQKALAKEFTLRRIPFVREKVLDVIYKEEKVGVYRPDFIVDDKVIIEIKALEYLPLEAKKQLDYYLRGTDYKLGLLVNFGPKLSITRWVYDTARQQ